MEITSNYPLKKLNTFHINAKAKYFTTISSVSEFFELAQSKTYLKEKKLILGGGSNILFAKDFDGLVIKNDVRGIEMIKEDHQHVWLRIGSGENWHELVLTCLKNKWYGLENLSLIPGTVGAAPVQNIGAYGVELKEYFESLTAYSLIDGAEKTFHHEDCGFGYRKSVFKSNYKNKLFITEVVLRLNKEPVVNLSYGAINDYFKENAITDLSPEKVSEAVIAIRKSKLPDPEVTGNGGSFFKNPVVQKEEFQRLEKTFPDIPHFAEGENTVKIPAGWLIEKCGWKGKKLGNAGVHARQALVLINTGEAIGTEIVELSKAIQKSVFELFQIKLEPEVNII